MKHYSLDAIISVGYRVNSKKATKFRQWTTKALKEYMIKGLHDVHTILHMVMYSFIHIFYNMY